MFNWLENLYYAIGLTPTSVFLTEQRIREAAEDEAERYADRSGERARRIGILEAECAGLVSLLLDVQQDCIDLRKEPTPEAFLEGARSIGKTMGDENHVTRARLCYQAIMEHDDAKD